MIIVTHTITVTSFINEEEYPISDYPTLQHIKEFEDTLDLYEVINHSSLNNLAHSVVVISDNKELDMNDERPVPTPEL